MRSSQRTAASATSPASAGVRRQRVSVGIAPPGGSHVSIGVSKPWRAGPGHVLSSAGARLDAARHAKGLSGVVSASFVQPASASLSLPE
jgi:hypothetical protein